MPSEHVVRWTGGRIGLGASVFHFGGTSSPTSAQNAADAIQAFFGSIRPILPIGVTCLADPEVKVYSAAGVLVDVIPISGRTGQAGSQSGVWANGVGGMIRWNTSAVVAGRRLQGRTFIVPMGSAQFDSSGNITTGARATANTAALTLISALGSNGTPLQIWSRKNAVVTDVLTGAMPTRPSTLRSRNDRS